MEKKMLEDIKELFQSFIAPQLEGIRGDIRALDAKIGAVDTKVESFRREMLAEIHRVEQVLSTDFVRLEQKLDLGLAAVDVRLVSMDEKLDSRLKAMDGKLDSRLASMDEKLDSRLASMDEKLDSFRREISHHLR